MTIYDITTHQGPKPSFTVSVCGNGLMHGHVDHYASEAEYNLAIARIQTMIALANDGFRLAHYSETLTNIADFAEKTAAKTLGILPKTDAGR